MGTVVLNGAGSGSTTLTPTDAVTAVITLPSATATLATLGANTFVGNQAIAGTLSASGQTTLTGGVNLTSVAGTSYIVDSYTGTLTGCTTSPTYTIRYTVIGNTVTLNIPDWTATSNTTSKTITGMPAALYPARTQYGLMAASDNGGSYVAAQFRVSTAGVLTFTATAGGNAWTGSGTAGSVAGAFTYTLA